jgi:magnesium-transporting ATPase (P-type)
VLFLCIVFYLHVYINSVKPLNGKSGFHLNCCRATKYFKSKTKYFKVTVKTQQLFCFDGNFKTFCFILEFKQNRKSSIKIKYKILLAAVKRINVLRSAC